MTSMTIGAQDVRLALSHLIFSLTLGQGPLPAPSSAFPAIVPGLAEARGFPQPRMHNEVTSLRKKRPLFVTGPDSGSALCSSDPPKESGGC